MKIYLDAAIITNTIVTLICLELTARIINKRISNKRVFAASLVGGLTSLLIAVSADKFYIAVIITIIKFLSFPIIVIIALKYNGLMRMIKNTVVFFAANLVYIGIVLLLWEFSDTKIIYIRNYTVYFNISILKLTIAVIITYALLTMIEVIKRISENAGKKYVAIYTHGNYQLTIPAVSDTGNKLCDSFSHEPIVVFYCDDLFFHYDLDSPESLVSGKFRLLPFETINGSGLIPITSNGKVEIADDKNKYSDLRCCIGIKRSDGSKARAIFNPEIIR